MSSVFALLIAAGPFLLPAAGVGLADLVFAVAVVTLAYTGWCCGSAARRDLALRKPWAMLAAGCGLAALAAGIGFIARVSHFSTDGAFYFGLSASLALVAASVFLAQAGARDARPDQVVDVLLICGLIGAAGFYFVAIPGFRDGDAALTVVFVVDLAALMLSAFSVIGGVGKRVGLAITLSLASIAAGDGLLAASSAGVVDVSDAQTVGLWLVGALILALGASWSPAGIDDQESAEPSARSAYLRALFPLPAVLAFGGLGVLDAALHGVRLGSVVFFGSIFLAALVAGFARQAYVVVANRRAALRERQLHAEATRRNEELEALTALATTMTESFDEEAILQRGLEVLRLAARASSCALHLGGDGGLALRAASGDWYSEYVFASPGQGPPAEPTVERRARRQIARLALKSRDGAHGLITIVRPEPDEFDSEELGLLALLVGQLGIALQNARDYHEKLEQAIRDPLTGLFNRRYFYAALDKEVARHERYGSELSLVIFDIDDFKQVNDRLGHAAGDEALRRVAAIAREAIRPSDTLGRLGGEEFAVLLPETGPAEAWTVAERIRTRLAGRPVLPSLTVKMSGGVSSCPQDGSTPDQLLGKADGALYWAKRNGKNICALADEVILDEDDPASHDALVRLQAVVDIIDAELRTGDHSENVAAYATAIGRALGLDGRRLLRLRRAALLHDIGKTAIDSDILGKPGALDEREFEEIKRHPAVGATMVAHAGFAEEASWIRHHHERIDGGGYPDGLAGEEIPLEARILFVADSFEAMTSDRPYRSGREVEDALVELGRCAGSQFDKRIVETLQQLVESGEVSMAPIRRQDLAAASG